ncbi:MAG: hypothetical protein CMM50_18675, partial [Rhodospirillaceae bacterium]|nr:hypothetical protein [Rhodospirillaceae bacterium]
GAGKTTVGLQFLMEGAERGEKGLILSVSQNVHELEIIAGSHDIDLSRVTVRTVGLEVEDREEQYALDTNEADLSELLRDIYRVIEEEAPDRLVFDSLLELRLLSPNAVFYRREILRLKRYLIRRKVCALILDHMDQSVLDRQIEGVAHGVIQMSSETPRLGNTHRQILVKKFRGHAFVEGYHDFKIVKGGLEVFPRVIPRELPPCQIGPTLGTGDQAFDDMLGGGLEFGSTTLIAGQSGTGKSTLSTLFAVTAARRGVKTGMFLFEERPEVYRERSRALGMDVGQQEKEGNLFFHHFDAAEVSAGEFSQIVLSRVEADDLGLVVIDSLSGYLNSLPDKDNVISQIHALLQFLSRRGTIGLVTMAQHGLLGEEPRSEIDLSFIADSVVLLRHFQKDDDIRRTIAVMKKRHSAHQHRIKNLIIGPGRVSIADFSSAFTLTDGPDQRVGD